jgi:predicted small lipoprotein YifL
MVITRFRSSPSFRSSVSLLLIVLCLSLSACGRSGSADINPQAEYDAAVQDARNMTAEKISKNLTAIVPENKNLQWENDAPGTRVLVATWLGNQAACESYLDPATSGCKAGSECANYWYNSWVTVVPELKNLLGRSPTLLRVDQALGLPPPAAGQTLDNTCILELYISPGNLFRPSPDPEVTDQEAELHFPSDGFRKYDDATLVYSEMPCDVARCPTCTPSGKCGMTTYRNWFDNRRAYVYSQTAVNSPYPWTGLGYTYDWGNPAPPHIGLSEFVINSGSNGIPVFIKSATWTRVYFAE